MADLAFLPNPSAFTPLRQLALIGAHEVPTSSGAYVLLADAGNRFQYPRRRSSVFYIGQARNLRSRLQTHARFALEARVDRRLPLYWPMYEYAAVFGCRYTFVLAGRRDPRLVERDLLALFAERHLSWPVANGAGGWDSLRPRARGA